MYLMAVALSPASVRQIHAIIRGALGQAVKWEWIDRNVALLATPPKLRRQPVKPVTSQAALALLASITDPDLAIAVRLAAATGARRGELCALRWIDVDLERGAILIRRSLAEVKGGNVEKGTKSYAERTVLVDVATKNELVRRRNDQMNRARDAGLPWQPSTHVLSRHPDGRAWLPSNLSATWHKHCGGVMRFHDWRHWSVSVALDAGINPRLVADRHGHADPNITLGIYGHRLDGRERVVADVIGAALNPGRG